MDRAESEPKTTTDRAEMEQILKGNLHPHKNTCWPCKGGTNLLHHPELVAFDIAMHKLRGELRAARSALYECKGCPSVINLLEHPKLVTLDEEMRQLVWSLHDGREALAEQVVCDAIVKQYSNPTADPMALKKVSDDERTRY